jgi:hypothetical protein
VETGRVGPERSPAAAQKERLTPPLDPKDLLARRDDADPYREVGGRFVWDPIDVFGALEDARAIAMASLEAVVDSIISRSTSS